MPAFFPAGQEAWLFLPLLASVYGFCQVQAKTDDGYFLGFPSLWNLVALYLYALPLGGWPSLAIVIVLALLTFVPIRHLYPSQPGLLNRVSMIAGVVWTPLVAWLIWKLPDGDATRALPRRRPSSRFYRSCTRFITWPSRGRSA